MLRCSIVVLLLLASLAHGRVAARPAWPETTRFQECVEGAATPIATERCRLEYAEWLHSAILKGIDQVQAKHHDHPRFANKQSSETFRDRWNKRIASVAYDCGIGEEPTPFEHLSYPSGLQCLIDNYEVNLEALKRWSAEPVANER